MVMLRFARLVLVCWRLARPVQIRQALHGVVLCVFPLVVQRFCCWVAALRCAPIRSPGRSIRAAAARPPFLPLASRHACGWPIRLAASLRCICAVSRLRRSRCFRT
jgi:hypothetical protein